MNTFCELSELSKNMHIPKIMCILDLIKLQRLKIADTLRLARFGEVKEILSGARVPVVIRRGNVIP